MSRKIRYCASCEKYTMAHKCADCDNETLLSGPLRFSPEDRFGHYRRMARMDIPKK